MPDTENRTREESDFVCASIVTFRDGECSGMLLHRGDKEACDRVMNTLPAVLISDPRPVERASLVVMPVSDWEAINA